jgi:hypothetical protein
MSVLFLPSASILTARNLISGLPSSPFLNQNLKTDTGELELKLGQESGRGDEGDAQEGSHTEEQIVAVLRQVEGGGRSQSSRDLSQGRDQPRSWGLSLSQSPDPLARADFPSSTETNFHAGDASYL